MRIVEAYGCGGQFGFMSSHAANTMALTVFLSLALPPRFRLFKWVLLIWTVISGYSRVYLAAHYPGDVLAGWAGGLWAQQPAFSAAAIARAAAWQHGQAADRHAAIAPGRPLRAGDLIEALARGR